MNEPAVDDFEVSATGVDPETIRAELAAVPSPTTASADDEDALEVVPGASSVEAGKKLSSRETKARSIQAEIDRDVARRETAKREADAEESRLAQLRAERARGDAVGAPTARSAASAATASEDDPEPTLESCDNDENKFLRAYSKWEMREAAREVLGKTEAKRREQEAVTAQQRSVETALATFSQNLDTAVGKDKREAFLKQVDPVSSRLVPYGSLAPGQPVTGYTAIADSVIASSIPDKLLLHFVAHPDDFDRIGTLTPNAALREVGILEGSLRVTAASRGPASRPLVASAAPPPTKPLGGSPSVSSDAEDEDVDDDSPEAGDRWIRRQNQKDTRSRALRR